MTNYPGNAPIGYTCPDIDEIIEKMDFAMQKASCIHSKARVEIYTEVEYADIIELIIDKLSRAISDMEKIRSDNAILREYGNEQYLRAERAEKERDEVIKDCDIIELELEYLKEQLKEEVEYDR
ncbi:MAG: type I 3-dehydroquinate dehydratase [Bacteroidales bacterium]|nr:type I 3-dehydroquinate dehydratase [Bacteroidales bacterium]